MTRIDQIDLHFKVYDESSLMVMGSSLARIHCDGCGHEVLLAYSCKTRCFCPSCHQKRMLVYGDWVENNVLAPVRHRQYVFTLPTEEGSKNGEIFHYQTAKTDEVNWVTNRATGLPFQDNFYKVLWSKLGTDGETSVLLDRNGTLFAGGGLNTTPK